MVALLSSRKMFQRLQPTSHGLCYAGSHKNTAMVSRMEEPMGHYGDMKQTIGHHLPVNSAAESLTNSLSWA